MADVKLSNVVLAVLLFVPPLASGGSTPTGPDDENWANSPEAYFLTAAERKEWDGLRSRDNRVDFIERYCRSQRGNAELFGPGRTLRLLDWQKDWIEEVMADGVNAAGLSIPRGAGKSTMLAAIGVAGLFLPNQAGAPTV